MKCRKCLDKAVLSIPRHNTALCGPCLTEYAQIQVERAIGREKMCTKENKILVAVSGGKDSLALWDILLKLGYYVDGLYVNLGIGQYSVRSRQKVEAFAELRNAMLFTKDAANDEGIGIRELADLVRRPTCAACGCIKRYQFNRVAVDQNYDVLATGHNLDDEAARLMGNVLRWNQEFLEKQGPVLPASMEGFAKKIKPLYRLTEREIAAYCVVNGIDYIVEDCPMATGSRLLVYKEALDVIEQASPGSKQSFYWGFLVQQGAKAQLDHQSMSDRDIAILHPCEECGQPTSAAMCSYCKLMAKAQIHQKVS
ncbi:MAG: tRNA(Ile)-lysidine synthetase [Nitrospiraceae bacterium]|nr:tRNA(Ile)-lysidine synthetase [Nitrospiraceae bacterium]|tara:strand:- start:1870 stop:2802 length:933 start_codon:yes stop_codon:yes gene_type:complete